MEKNEYIEFELNDEDKLRDLKLLLKLISESKISGDYKTDEYWLNTFPDYTHKHYFFSGNDVKPEFHVNSSNDNIWHFYSLVEHLVENIDVEFLSCEKIERGKGRLDFYACGYPYRGITGLTIFLRSFGFRAIEIDEGGAVYSIRWKNEIEFERKEIKGPNSSWWKRFKDNWF